MYRERYILNSGRHRVHAIYIYIYIYIHIIYIYINIYIHTHTLAQCSPLATGPLPSQPLATPSESMKFTNPVSKLSSKVASKLSLWSRCTKVAMTDSVTL